MKLRAVVLRLIRRREPIVAMSTRVAPDPAWTEALERKRAALTYRPEDGFVLDRVQRRKAS